jgi:hypothetical protein
MCSVAYDYGKFVTVCVFDETGAAESEVDFGVGSEETPTEVLESAGYSVGGDWAIHPGEDVPSVEVCSF